jgi:hydroxymethylpyrimidine/phosphomethylpyrimidine kinase
MLQMHNTYCVLTIAGSDSCGGAGIQADLKTFGLFAVEGASVITAITAQNTLGVNAVESLSPDFVRAQLEAVLEDLPIRAAKTGMLANRAIIDTLAEGLDQNPHVQLVVDPVMVATSGARLLNRDAEQALRERLLPRAALVTPNRPEAAALTGLSADAPAEQLAESILAMGCRAVLIKGGHAGGATVEDVLVTDGERERYTHPRVAGRIHGTGCALSAAITAGLGRGEPMNKAVGNAITWLQVMIAHTWQPRKGELEMLPFGMGERLKAEG